LVVRFPNFSKELNPICDISLFTSLEPPHTITISMFVRAVISLLAKFVMLCRLAPGFEVMKNIRTLRSSFNWYRP